MSLAQDIRNAYDNRDRDALEHALRRMEAAIRPSLHPVQGEPKVPEVGPSTPCPVCGFFTCKCKLEPRAPFVCTVCCTRDPLQCLHPQAIPFR